MLFKFVVMAAVVVVRLVLADHVPSVQRIPSTYLRAAGPGMASALHLLVHQQANALANLRNPREHVIPVLFSRLFSIGMFAPTKGIMHFYDSPYTPQNSLI